MTTIHDEEKIEKEILEFFRKQCPDSEVSEYNYYVWVFVEWHLASMKSYAEHIRLKTIDEAIGCAPVAMDYTPYIDKDMPTNEEVDSYNSC